MFRRVLLLLLPLATILTGCSYEKIYQAQLARSRSPYEQVDFQALVKRYMKKDKPNSIEGIYSVSGWVTKKGKGFLGSTEKERTTDRHENYAQVAILADPGDTGRDFIEISLDKNYLPRYPVVGEFNLAASGNILVYKHLDPKKENTSYTFTFDRTSEILEGISVENEGATTVTYKLTYVKIYPKN